MVGVERWAGAIRSAAETSSSVVTEDGAPSAQSVAVLVVLVVLADEGEEGARLVFLTLGDASGVGGKVVMAVKLDETLVSGRMRRG